MCALGNLKIVAFSGFTDCNLHEKICAGFNDTGIKEANDKKGYMAALW